MKDQLLFCAVMGYCFLTIFAIGEWLRRRCGVNPELTRKWVHFGGCALAMGFPLVLESHVYVLGLSLSFIGLMWTGERFGFLRSVYDVDRKSLGEIYHPLAIYLCFAVAQWMGNWILYEIPLLVLAVSDSLAAMIGKRYGRVKYSPEIDAHKSLEGSVVFGVFTFLIVEISLLLLTNAGRVECILVAVLIAVLITLFEAISLRGSDNLFIPLGTLFILAKNIHPWVPSLIYQLIVLTFSVIGIHLLLRPYRQISRTGAVGLMLGIYAAWGLLDEIWMIPMVYGIILVCRTPFFLSSRELDMRYRVRECVALVVVPVFWVLCANIYGGCTLWSLTILFYPAYLYALVGQMMISRALLLGMKGRGSAFRLAIESCLFSLFPWGCYLRRTLDWEMPWEVALVEGILAWGLIFLTARVWERLLSKRIPSKRQLLIRTLLIFFGSLLIVSTVFLWEIFK